MCLLSSLDIFEIFRATAELFTALLQKSIWLGYDWNGT